MSDRDRRGAAYHEAGHAVVAWCLGLNIGPIAIGIGGDDAAGRADIQSDQSHLSEIDRLAVYLAGAEAQDVFQAPTNDLAGYADLAQAVEVIGGWDAPDEHRRQMLDAGHRRARELVTRHKDKIVRLAQELVRRGSLEPVEFEEVIGGNNA